MGKSRRAGERMGTVARAIACVATASALAGHANAHKAEAPDIRVGDRWSFVVWYTVPSTTPNREWIVTSVGASGIEATENGEPLRLTRELGVVDSPQTASSNPKVLDFPLTVGKRWRYANDWAFKPKGSRGSIDVDVSVISFEKVKVPAGEFDAFKLESIERLSGRSPAGSVYDGETTRTYWYAPSVRAIVKSVSRNPYLGPSTVELVSCELKR
jgi:hypothetical protein